MRAAPFWINKHGTVPPSATVSLLCSCFLPFSVFGISPVLGLHKTVPLFMLGWQLQQGTALYLQCQLGEEDAEGASHRRRAGISSLTHGWDEEAGEGPPSLAWLYIQAVKRKQGEKGEKKGGRQREFKYREKKKGRGERVKNREGTSLKEREQRRERKKEKTERTRRRLRIWEREEITLSLSYLVEPGLAKTLWGFWKVPNDKREEGLLWLSEVIKKAEACPPVVSHFLHLNVQDPQVWVLTFFFFNICKAIWLVFFFLCKICFLLLFGTFIFHLSDKVVCLPTVPPMPLSLACYLC